MAVRILIFLIFEKKGNFFLLGNKNGHVSLLSSILCAALVAGAFPLEILGSHPKMPNKNGWTFFFFSLPTFLIQKFQTQQQRTQRHAAVDCRLPSLPSLSLGY
jgi:hypothetical protein